VSYLVFARKYRPRTFSEVIGQEHVATTLRNAIAGGRLAHAYLFAGPRGVGKTTMARILAKSINCLETPGPEPCGTCDACLGIAAGTDVDVIEIDAASNRGVGDVEPLIDTARYLPQRSARRIFILDEAHMLSTTAWNALLKTLEEPPAHVLFIFCTTQPQKVIETVRSRCQGFDFHRITPADIEGKLKRIVENEGLEVAEDLLREIALRSTGGLRDAETMLDQLVSSVPEGEARSLGVADLLAVLGDTPREQRMALLRKAHAGEAADALDAADGLLSGGADPAVLLQDLFGDVHDETVALARGGESDLGMEWCLAAAELLGRHMALAGRSRAPRAALDLAMLALTKLGEVADLEELVARLERLAGGPATPPASAPGTVAAAPGSKPDLRRNLAQLKRRGAEAAPDGSAGKPEAPAGAARGGSRARSWRGSAPCRGSRRCSRYSGAISNR